MSDIPITSISEAFNKVSGDPIHRIQGKLIKIGKARRQIVKGGAVIFYQDANLAGPDGKEIIKVKFGRETEIEQTYSGQLVELSCYNSKDWGWVGVKVEDEAYTNKAGQLVESRVLKVSKTANIELLSSGPAPAAPRAAAKPAPRAAQAATARQPQPQQAASNGDPMLEIQRKARRITTLMDTCLTCAGWLADKHNLGPDGVRAVAATIFIEMKSTTDFNALPGYDPRKQETAPPRPPEPPAPSESEFPDEDSENVPF